MTSTRKLCALATCVLFAALLAFDLSASEPPNPYQAPPLVALGSGQAAGGAHCAALPSQ
ncbi:hypothetical protein SAMN04490244_102219 [Tranquillimonas rosea]|uniref:Uncharacterized protein n=1 Tax=Tranquillimonas rosea TaxID=641238 RepID=A0A1H9RF35_9RHOB|nr:hypothetical protein [Tranquillimonas rosea]SER70593.1 hypothetical protein SAMN04490244_102219 [Tranquillimonas rosea]